MGPVSPKVKSPLVKPPCSMAKDPPIDGATYNPPFFHGGQEPSYEMGVLRGVPDILKRGATCFFTKQKCEFTQKHVEETLD